MTGLENPTHILFVLVVAVLVLGPKRPAGGGPLARSRHPRVQEHDGRREAG